MKSSQVIAVLAATLAFGVEADVSTTVAPKACPTMKALANDIVTRSDVAASPCTVAALSVISNAASGSASAGNATTHVIVGTGTSATATGKDSSSTSAPISAAGKRVVGGFGGALVVAAAVLYLV